MGIYDINGNLIRFKENGVELTGSQVDSIYGFIKKTAFLSNIEKEKNDFEKAFNLTRDNLFPIETVDSNFEVLTDGTSFHATITRGYHVTLTFDQIHGYVVSFARMKTYSNQFDYLPSMYTLPSNEQIEVGVSNVVMDGITSFAIRSRIADSNQNGNVRTGSINSSSDFSNIVTLETAEPTGAFYISVNTQKNNALLEFDFNLKVGGELWV